ncbi:MAG: glycosyltransferase family 2 protein [bacterium]|nr:glycosyltransferase family 2 protein [bacterium]
MKLSVVIPAYNEEASIRRTITTVADYVRTTFPDGEIIVIDDGSTDHTRDIVRSLMSTYPLRFITHKKNKGKGAAVRTGALSAHGDYILFMDADMSTHIQEFDGLYRALVGGADIAIGSRYMNTSHVVVYQPWFRVILGRIANTIVRMMLLPRIYDTQCGFKAFTHETALILFHLQTMERWSFDVELLVLARRLGYTIVEVPITWEDSRDRKSRFRAVRDANGMVLDVLRVMYAIACKRYGDLDQHKKIR